MKIRMPLAVQYDLILSGYSQWVQEVKEQTDRAHAHQTKQRTNRADPSRLKSQVDDTDETEGRPLVVLPRISLPYCTHITPQDPQETEKGVSPINANLEAPTLPLRPLTSSSPPGSLPPPSTQVNNKPNSVR